MSTAAEVKWALWHSTVSARMFADPDLTGDALLFSLCLLGSLTDRRIQGRRGAAVPFEEIRDRTGLRPYSIKRVIADDAPRYEPPRVFERSCCIAPMIRRDGPCGKHATHSWMDRDPLTGEASHVGYCRRHMTRAADLLRWDRYQQWLTQGKPVPPNNVGGVLPRYFATDWDKWYAWAAPWRVDTGPGPDPPPPRARLRLIQGGEVD